MKIQRANPVLMRSALEIAFKMVRAGILFVPVPVDESQWKEMMIKSADQLERLARIIEEGEG